MDTAGFGTPPDGCLSGCDTVNGRWYLTKYQTLDENLCIYRGTKSVSMNCERLDTQCSEVRTLVMELQLSCDDGFIGGLCDIRSEQLDSTGHPCVMIAAFGFALCESPQVQNRLLMLNDSIEASPYCSYAGASVTVNLPFCNCA